MGSELNRDPIELRLDEVITLYKNCPHLANGACSGDNCKGLPEKA